MCTCTGVDFCFSTKPYILPLPKPTKAQPAYLRSAEEIHCQHCDQYSSNIVTVTGRPVTVGGNKQPPQSYSDPMVMLMSPGSTSVLWYQWLALTMMMSPGRTVTFNEGTHTDSHSGGGRSVQVFAPRIWACHDGRCT